MVSTLPKSITVMPRRFSVTGESMPAASISARGAVRHGHFRIRAAGDQSPHDLGLEESGGQQIRSRSDQRAPKDCKSVVLRRTGVPFVIRIFGSAPCASRAFTRVRSLLRTAACSAV